MNPSGIRFGTPPITTRGLKETDMEKVVDLVDKGNEKQSYHMRLNCFMTH